MALRSFFPRFIPAFLIALVPACGDDSADGTGGGSGTESATATSSASTATGGETGGGGGATEVPDICRTGTAWAPGTAIFTEATADWQLEAIGAAGTRLDAVDFDGDGWTDLLVRTGADLQDDFAAGGVRGSWLLRNTGAGTFEDVTESSGLRTPRDGELGRAGDTISFADVDNDGDLDALTGYVDKANVAPTANNEVLLNDGAGHFTLLPEPSSVNASGANTPAAVSFVDADNNGIIDVWIPNNAYNGSPKQAHLFYGDGTGNFYDATEVSGLTTASWNDIEDLNTAHSHANSWSGAACDLNGDGFSELLTASYGRAPNLLFEAQGPDGGYLYENISIESGYAFDERTDWSDNESARCWCTLNPDDVDCEGVPEPEYILCNSEDDAFRWDHSYDREPFRLGGNSGATMCADVDNDGDIDLVTTAIVHWDVGSTSDPAELLLNTGEAELRFERPGNDATGLARDYGDQIDWNEGIMTGSVFDFDNDGWLDIYYGGSDYPGQRGFLYHQVAPGEFEQVALADGIDHHRSHGSAVADFDRDGDLDIVVGHSTARCDGDNVGTDCYASQQVRFFENTFAQDGNFVALTLEGTTANRSAIGARVTVTADGVTQTRDVGGGHGHFGAQDDLTVFFGLGNACEADITIRWPDGALTTESMHLKGNRRWKVVQGTAAEVATP